MSPSDPQGGPVLDCLVVGGGPAGLTAALYLARFHRRVMVIDDGRSRARWIPTSHNCPGFPEGISGTAFLDSLRRQATHYGVPVVSAKVEDARREGVLIVAHAAGQTYRARAVVLATGIEDALPAMDDPEEAIGAGLLRLCPICDGYEATGRRIGIVGPRGKALSEAAFLATYSEDLTILPTGPDEGPDAGQGDKAPWPVAAEIRAIERQEDGVAVRTADGAGTRFDVIYAAMGAKVRSDLAARLGAQLDGNGCVRVDPHQKAAEGLVFAAGDVVSELNQIAVATGHAAIAATAIHNALRQADAA